MGKIVAGIVVVGVIGALGYCGYKYYQDHKAEKPKEATGPAKVVSAEVVDTPSEEPVYTEQVESQEVQDVQFAQA